MKLTRRNFLQSSLPGLAGAAMSSAWLAQLTAVESRNDIPYRRLGSTDDRVSLLGVGGHHIGRGEESEAIRLIREALDNGVNFLDNAWEYHDGVSEERVGKAIRGRRDQAYVMTKHHGRKKDMAMQHLEDSLRRLNTDSIDLWMFHECVYDQDPDRIFGPDGGIEAAELAKQQGKVRRIGFTGHKDPAIHLKMLAYDYPWDAVLMPLNPLDGNFKSFEKWVLPVLVQRGIAPLAMKSRASGIIIRNNIATPEECWRYVTSLPVATVVSGMESIELLRDNLRLARTLTPMLNAEKQALLARTEEKAATGKFEPFKTSRAFDGPIGRRMYGIS